MKRKWRRVSVWRFGDGGLGLKIGVDKVREWGVGSRHRHAYIDTTLIFGYVDVPAVLERLAS